MQRSRECSRQAPPPNSHSLVDRLPRPVVCAVAPDVLVPVNQIMMSASFDVGCKVQTKYKQSATKVQTKCKLVSKAKYTTADDEPEPGWFFVDKLLESRRNRKTGQREYLVKWANYPVEEATWERRENISSRLVDQFDADQADSRAASRVKAAITKRSTDLPDATKPHHGKSGPTVADKRVPCEEAFDSKDPFKGEIDILRKQFPSMKHDLALWERLETGEITVDDLPEEDRWMADLYSPPPPPVDLSSRRSSSPTVFTFHSTTDTPSTVSRCRRNPARAARPMAPAPPTSVNEETTDSEGEDASDWSIPNPDPVLYQKGVENLCRDPFIKRAFANGMEGSRRPVVLSRPDTHRSYAERKQIRYPARAPCWGDADSSSSVGTSGAGMEQDAYRHLAALLDPLDNI